MAHRQLCHLFAGPSISTLPPVDVRSVQGIVLPVNRTDPYFTTVTLHGNMDSTGVMHWSPQLESIQGVTDFPTSVVSLKGVGDRLLRFPLQLYFEIAPNMMSKSSARLNECARALTGGTDHPWKGNIVVLKFNGSRRQAYMDVEDPDISRVAHFLLHSG